MAATPPVCEFGWKPVDAELPGTDGETHSILSAAGPNGLVVAFICNHCPYVKAVVDRMAICANDAQSYPEDSFPNMQAFAARHNFPFAYLHDETQATARAWDAVCTPDFFGFNTNMELQYRGRLDAARLGSDASGIRRDLLEAMTQVAQTGEGPQDQIPSMGCSIKWKNAH